MRFGLKTFLISCVVCGITFSGIYYVISLGVTLSKNEFVEISGRQAKALMSTWPSNVLPDEIDSVYLKNDYHRDGYSLWYRMNVTRSVASKWQKAIHVEKQNRPLEFMDQTYEGYEGINRVIPLPPKTSSIGTPPNWWLPPQIPFQATEIMIWSTDSQDEAWAVYSGFDPDKNVLWVYSYASQFDRLWQQGKPPRGETFSGR